MASNETLEKLRRLRESKAPATASASLPDAAATDAGGRGAAGSLLRLASSAPPSFASSPNAVFRPRNPHAPLCVPLSGAAAARAMELALLGPRAAAGGEGGEDERTAVAFAMARDAGAGAGDGGVLGDAAYEAECRAARLEPALAAAHPTACRDKQLYQQDEVLAQGAYGVVLRATAGGATYALKHIKKKWLEDSRAGFPLYLLREFDLLLRMRHPNVVRAVEVVLQAEAPAARIGEKRPRGDPSASPPSPPPPGGPAAAAAAAAEAPPGPSATQVMASVGAASHIRDVFLVMEHCAHDLWSFMTRPVTAGGGEVLWRLHLSRANGHPGAPRAYVAKAKCVLYQLCRGLDFLHRHRVLHRDLKSSNVLVTAGGRVKLCDFGLGRHYREGAALTANVVTPLYRAPELFFGARDYGSAVDVWSAGCIFAELFLKKPLFAPGSCDAEHVGRLCAVLGVPTEESCPGVYRLAAARDLVRGLGSWNRESHLRALFRGTAPESAAGGVHTPSLDAAAMPDSGLDLLEQMLRWDPAARPSAAEVLAHRFFTEEPLPCAPSELMTPLPTRPLK